MWRPIVRHALRRAGIEAVAYRRSVRARRVQILRSSGVDLVVDVGANKGQYAADIRGAGYDGRIVSFEPLAKPFEMLRRRSAGDAAWDCHRVAVGDTKGRVVMNVGENDIFSSPMDVLDQTVEVAPRSRTVGVEDVAIDVLDDLIANLTYERLAIKIDVQGFEGQVLSGAPRSLAEASVVELELSPVEIYSGQALMVEMMRRLEGYDLVLSLVENLLPDWNTGRSHQFNGIFVKRTSA